jgi:hypothetical protein
MAPQAGSYVLSHAIGKHMSSCQEHFARPTSSSWPIASDVSGSFKLLIFSQRGSRGSSFLWSSNEWSRPSR